MIVRYCDNASDKLTHLSTEVLFELIIASDNLGIKSLTDLGCRTIADMVRGKSPLEITTMFKITLPPNEMAELLSDGLTN